jgi:nucleoside-diphosphate-sugar epimerase
VEVTVLDGEKVLITGAGGKIAFPLARSLAGRNEVWGAARFTNPSHRDRLTEAGVHAVQLDVSTGDFGDLPNDFTYVFHAATAEGVEGWPYAVQTNAQASGQLLHHCRKAKGFVYCSTGSIYQYQGHRPLKEEDPPGVPLRSEYSFSKVAGEAVCTWISTQFRIPVSIIRICSTYGPLGGAPADRLEAMLQGRPIRLHPDQPNNFNPIYEDDYVRLGIRAMEVAQCPPLVVNWAGSETVSAEDYCTYMGELVGIDPIFEYTSTAHTPLWPDVTFMHEVLGPTEVHWRDGFRRMVAARHPELQIAADVPGGPAA